MQPRCLVQKWILVLLTFLAFGPARKAGLAVEPKAVLTTNGQGVNSLAFSPDGELIAAACQSDDIELWEVRTRKRRFTLEGHTAPVQAVAFSGDGKLLASGGDDGTVRLWYTAAGIIKATLRGGNGYISCVAFSGDGTLVASGGKDKAVTVWDVASRKVKATLKGHKQGKKTLFSSPIMSVAFNPDGKRLASGGADGKIIVWDLQTGKANTTLTGSAKEGVRTVAFSPDGKLLASGSFDGRVKLWDVGKAKLKIPLGRHYYEAVQAVSCVAFSPDGKLLASTSAFGLGDDEWEEPPDPLYQIKMWEVATGRERGTLSGKTGQILSVAFSPDSKLLATGDCPDLAFPKDRPAKVRLWKVRALLKFDE